MTEIAASQIAANRAEYGELYSQLRFVTAAEAELARARRDSLLARLQGRVEIGCKGTKLDCANLSPGCRFCINGTWSCLVISSQCNCSCFFCPTSQNELGVPGTNAIDFPRADDYADFTHRLGFDGVSLSGGEPLLSPHRTLEYLEAVRARRGDAVHTWLYTNGTLLTPELLQLLRTAGLGEIRLDIAATGYDLSKVAMAIGVIPTVTVEIPALPDDVPLLQRLLGEMAAMGVNYLNLHQLRLTPHNLPRLVRRSLTFLHGDKVTVLESELAALELIAYALDRGIPLPINYCSYAYKSRFQHAAARRRAAGVICKPYEDITENGYLRALALIGPPPRLQAQVARFQAEGIDPSLYRLDPTAGHLAVAASLWSRVAVHDLACRVRYCEVRLRSALSYQYPFVEIELDSGTSLYAEKLAPGCELHLSGADLADYAVAALGAAASPIAVPALSPVAAPWRAALDLELIRPGLQDYF